MESGPIGKTLLAFTLPVLLCQLLQMLYNITDYGAGKMERVHGAKLKQSLTPHKTNNAGITKGSAAAAKAVAEPLLIQ